MLQFLEHVNLHKFHIKNFSEFLINFSENFTNFHSNLKTFHESFKNKISYLNFFRKFIEKEKEFINLEIKKISNFFINLIEETQKKTFKKLDNFYLKLENLYEDVEKIYKMNNFSQFFEEKIIHHSQLAQKIVELNSEKKANNFLNFFREIFQQFFNNFKNKNYVIHNKEKDKEKVSENLNNFLDKINEITEMINSYNKKAEIQKLDLLAKNKEILKEINSKINLKIENYIEFMQDKNTENYKKINEKPIFSKASEIQFKDKKKENFIKEKRIICEKNIEITFKKSLLEKNLQFSLKNDNFFSGDEINSTICLLKIEEKSLIITGSKDEFLRIFHIGNNEEISLLSLLKPQNESSAIWSLCRISEQVGNGLNQKNNSLEDIPHLCFAAGLENGNICLWKVDTNNMNFMVENTEKILKAEKFCEVETITAMLQIYINNENKRLENSNIPTIKKNFELNDESYMNKSPIYWEKKRLIFNDINLN